MEQQNPLQLQRLRRITHFVLDMDGTIYLGNRLFPFTKAFLQTVTETRRNYLFFTNNSSKNRASYIGKLRHMGILIPPEQMLVANEVLLTWLQAHHPGQPAYVVGTPELLADFRQAGIPLSPASPTYVVLGFDTTLTYEKLRIACHWIRQGCPVYGVNPDWNCPTEEGMIPDCGAIAALVQASTGVSCEFFGKPSPHTLQYLLHRTGAKPHEIAIVGDRLYTDIATAAGTEVLSILVLSGESCLADVAASSVKPDLIFEDLGGLGSALRDL